MAFNTAIAKAKDPIQMAEAMKLAVISGRNSFFERAFNSVKREYEQAVSDKEKTYEEPVKS